MANKNSKSKASVFSLLDKATIVFMALFIGIGSFWLLFSDDSDPKALSPEKAVQKNIRVASKRESTRQLSIMSPIKQAGDSQWDLWQGNQHYLNAQLEEVVTLIDDGEVIEAEQLLKEYLEEQPKLWQGWLELSLIYSLDYGDSDKAIDYMEKALEINPENEALNRNMVELYLSADQVADGIAFYVNLLASHPKSFQIPYQLGHLYLAYEDLDAAMKYLEQASDGHSDHFGVNVWLARAWKKRGKLSEAVHYWERAVVALETTIRQRIRMGLPAEYLSDLLDEVLLEFTKALVDMGERDRAQDNLTKLVQRIPNHPEVLSLLSYF